MPSFSSISLANTRVKYTLFVLAYLIAVALYWPSFSGIPVWDDYTYLFSDPVMKPSFSYIEIWKNFTWPLSVTLHKALLGFVGKEYWFFHTINFILHAFNSWLVYRLLRLMRMSLSFSFAGFVFFLIHPASVITVAWMIQFKTLICFTFSLGAIFFFIRARNKKDYFISLFLFLLSVLSKSSALPLPLVLVFLLGKTWRSKKALWVIPYLLISVAGYYRLTNSQVAAEAIKLASEVTAKQVTPLETFKPLPDEPLVMPESDFTPGDVKYDKAKKWESPVEPTLSNAEDSKLVAHSRLFIKTLYYYFWQAVVPVDLAPVKGQNPFPPSHQEYLHLIFLVVLTAATWRMNLLPSLIGAHIFLLPYLGIIPAPYMNVTWVSDQHLYLALPCFILFILGLAAHLKTKWVFSLLGILMIFFMVKTHEGSKMYQNNFTFYEASVNSNLNNIPIIYNLSMLYVLDGRKDDAVNLMGTIIDASEEETYIRDNRFYPFLLDFHSKLSGK